MAHEPLVSIIIPTKNAGRGFRRSLEAVHGALAPFGFEVIIVDSGSADDTLETASAFRANVIEIHPLSFSHGRARNIGAKSAKGSILVFMTQDAVPAHTRWLENLVRWFDDPAVAGVYGRQIARKRATPLERFFSDYVYPPQTRTKTSVDPSNVSLGDIFFSNVNSAVRKSDWEDHEFDEELIMSEDQEWSRHMLLSGRKIVYDSGAAVFHSHRYSAADIVRRNFDSGISLKGLVNAPLARTLKIEADYLKAGFSFFARNKNYRYLILFPVYEAARLGGFFMGFHSRYLPRRVKVFLSQHKGFWRSSGRK